MHHSIWPAGIDSEPQGTIEWAGGLINWNDSDYEAAGHFYTLIKSVSIQCADPASPNSYLCAPSAMRVQVRPASEER